ncbi:MAG: septum formation initiator family protein [Leucobacter sp.]|jgi:cell division protein FtsB|nr:septum formation initiator family protein [Leucobacter sp.]
MAETKRKLRDEFAAWFASLRFSAMTVVIVGLVVMGGLIVSPTLTTYVQQQRELAELRESVRQQSENVAEADAERAKWLDPSYVRSQARGRLFYVMPGETQLSVIEDVVIPSDSGEETSSTLTSVESNWAHALVTSTLVAGTTNASPEQLQGDAQADAPAPVDTGEAAEQAATE